VTKKQKHKKYELLENDRTTTNNEQLTNRLFFKDQPKLHSGQSVSLDQISVFANSKWRAWRDWRERRNFI